MSRGLEMLSCWGLVARVSNCSQQPPGTCSGLIATSFGPTVTLHGGDRSGAWFGPSGPCRIPALLGVFSLATAMKAHTLTKGFDEDSWPGQCHPVGDGFPTRGGSFECRQA